MAESTTRELEHCYGPRVHLASDPYLLAILARIGQPATVPPLLFQLLRTFYRVLLARAVASEFPVRLQAVDTRMKQSTAQGVWSGTALDPAATVVIANVMRAGNLPSMTCFEELCAVLDPTNVRVDHFYFARHVDERGRVTGVDAAGSKVGGSVEGRILLVPDPMGATGSTTLRTLEAYRSMDAGRPAKTVALHLIVTPEYLRRVLAATKDVVIYAGRVDRGLSAPDVLESVPGTFPDRERGLNEHDYIVPGAGGLGEVITNAWC